MSNWLISNAKINKTIRKYRVFEEHVIRLLKIFRIDGTAYRHDRSEYGKIVYLCANLCSRRTKIVDWQIEWYSVLFYLKYMYLHDIWRQLVFLLPLMITSQMNNIQSSLHVYISSTFDFLCVFIHVRSWNIF